MSLIMTVNSKKSCFFFYDIRKDITKPLGKNVDLDTSAITQTANKKRAISILEEVKV